MNIIDLIQQIARSDEIMAKIRAAVISPDPQALPAFVGIGSHTDPASLQCDASWGSIANTSFAFGDIIDNGAGPVPGEPCSHMNTITGLVDLDTSQAPASFGSVVDLILQMDGVFK